MSWDVDEKEFYETFAEIESERGIEDAKLWAWTALDWTQKELRERETQLAEERKDTVAYIRKRAEKIKFTLAERSIPLLQEIAYSIELNQHHKAEE